MFSLEGNIDTIQNSKKSFVKIFVKNEVIAKSLNDFIDAQTAYTKAATNAGSEAFAAIAGEVSKSMSEMGKIDYAKFGEGVMKAWQAQQKSIFKI
jgi:hypothetical protein